MTQIGHFLCLLLGCLIGHLIVYIARGIWNFLTEKRVEIPEIKYDVTDNPILTLKNRLGQAYVATYDRTAKKLLHRLLEYVEWIDNWHKEQVLIVESQRNDYKRLYEQSREKLESECSKSAELTKQLKDAELKNKQLRQILKLNISKPLFTPQDWQNTYGKEPIPVETVKTEEALKRSIPMDTGAIIHIDSEDLNRYSVGRGPDGELLKDELPISNEVAEKLRDWWGLEADKEKPSRKSIYDMSSVEMQEYFRDILIDRNVHNLPLNRYKVEVFKSVYNGRRAMLTEWILPATSINAIRNVLGEEGIQVVGAEELP